MTKKLVAKTFRSVGKRCFRLADALYPPRDPKPETVRERLVRKWYADNAETTLRYQYDLGPNDIVFDIGGFEGNWAAEIAARYACKIHLFEPVPDYAAQIRLRFKGNPRIEVHAFGLSHCTHTSEFYLAGDSSSAIKSSDQRIQVRLQDVVEFLDAHDFHDIALAKINIEGAEFDLLQRLISSGAISRFRNIQVQFHDFVVDAEARMQDLQQRLSRTHALTYQYTFVWENWLRKCG
jgi:FkbM family methyltransferase